MEPELKRNRSRETMLTVSLVIVLGGSIAFFLNVVSLGVFTYVLGAVGVFTAIGFIHYVLWGYAMSRDTAGERAELARREGVEGDVDSVTRHAVHDVSRRRRDY